MYKRQLVDRRLPGAMIHEGEVAAERMVQMVQEGAILTEQGKLETRIDTICVHGDSAEAVALSAAVRQGLEASGIELKQFDGQPLS